FFTLSQQLAGASFDEIDRIGEIDYEGFVGYFDKFSWEEQLAEYERKLMGTSATLKVSHSSNSHELWVSAMGNKEDFIFILGFIYPKIRKSFFGLGKSAAYLWMQMYLCANRSLVIQCFQYFFEERRRMLEIELNTLRSFGEQEPYPLY
ncbi:MAG: hypothetical protein AAFU64_01535, partial [Bacteroidota bacterium]